MKAKRRIRLLLKGLRRRSALCLDVAGCPLWLTRRLAPAPKDWGGVLVTLGNPSILLALQQDWTIKAEDILRARIAELEKETEQ